MSIWLIDTVRTTRARIIHLRNDYKDLMSNIEKFLHNHFANAEEAPESDNRPAIQPVLPDAQPVTLGEPFAKVNTVAPGSPADGAGLKPGDEIRTFGYVDGSNHDNLRKVAECVQGNEGVSQSYTWCLANSNTDNSKSNIFIRVSRPTDVAQRQELRLTLTPRRDWGGRGLLGCHILPI